MVVVPWVAGLLVGAAVGDAGPGHHHERHQLLQLGTPLPLAVLQVRVRVRACTRQAAWPGSQSARVAAGLGRGTVMCVRGTHEGGGR